MILALFRSTFSNERLNVPTVNLHQHVETCLGELKAAGVTPLPQRLRKLSESLNHGWSTDRWDIHCSKFPANGRSADGSIPSTGKTASLRSGSSGMCVLIARENPAPSK